MKKHCFFLILILLQACNADKSKKVDFRDTSFATSESSELFFKNVRQSEYFTEENAEAGLLLYRHRDWPASAPFTPVLVFNWRQDRAYVLIEWQKSMSNKLPVEVVARSGDKEEKIVYAEGNMREQLRFLTSIYNAVQDGATLSTGTQEELALFTNEERKTFRIIMFDYFRLTGLY